MTDGPVFCRLCNEPIHLVEGHTGPYWSEYPPAYYPDACSGGPVGEEAVSHEPPLDLPPATDRTSVEEWLDA